MLVKYILTIFSCLIYLTIQAQNHYLLDDFKAFKDGDRVILNWTMKKGSTCIGTGIHRSTDKINYEVIGEISGICGNAEFAQSFTFIDEMPVKNRKNFYVLELGFSGLTDPPVVVEFIDISKNNYKVIPNPIKGEGRIYFDNKHDTKHTLYLYDISGKWINNFHTNADFFLVDLSEIEHSGIVPYIFNDNIFIFRIFDEQRNEITNGRFIGFIN